MSGIKGHTPLPIWVCEEGHIHVIGSRQELREMATTPVGDIELHRPYVDQVEITCPECGKPMHRVKEVIDCWYDSGSMPFAQWHYPFENKEIFEKRFPANFISEAIDQTRGWFYTLMAISTLMFHRAPFENCIVLGHVQDKDGQKMSKHKGNVVDPWSVLDRAGRRRRALVFLYRRRAVAAQPLQSRGRGRGPAQVHGHAAKYLRFLRALRQH